MRKCLNWAAAATLTFALTALPALASAATQGTATVKSSAELAAELGVLLGDGQGVNAAYLAKTTTRMQAAILYLRLTGKEKEAAAYSGTATFSDASTTGPSNRPTLAYLKNHPELGWQGTGNGKFDPGSPATSQQLYKVALEALGYKTNMDFVYSDTLTFAASKGLWRAVQAKPFTNDALATVLVEAVQATPKNGTKSLGAMLTDHGVIAAEKAEMLAGGRIDTRMTTSGETYLTDGKGMALYTFTKDEADLESCQGQCLVNWPVYAQTNFVVASGLNASDFGVIKRADGTKQATYKGWPLYYFKSDAKAGDTLGQGVGNVWFLAGPSTKVRGEAAEKVTIEIKNFAFSQPDLKVKAGTTIEFVNRDTTKHNAVAVDGSFATPLLEKDASATITLTKPGTYDYYCEPHQDHMKAKIIVE